jgi:hypothetical protein
MEQDDQAPRFLPLETVRVRFFSPPHTDGRLIFGIVSNLSETGACIITNTGLPVGVAVGLTIENWRQKGSLEVSARLVWCAERFEPMKEIVGYLNGVSFEPDGIEGVRRLLGSGLFQSIP